jgi:hypothetical protein
VSDSEVVAALYRETKRERWCSHQDAPFFARYITPNINKIWTHRKDIDMIEVGGKRVDTYAKFRYRFGDYRMKTSCNCLTMISIKRTCEHGQEMRKNCFFKIVIQKTCIVKTMNEKHDK